MTTQTDPKARENTNKNSKILPKFDPYNGKNPYLFVSYSHADNDMVNDVMNKLDEQKYRLWYDAALEVGNDFREELVEKIQNCGAVVFFISAHSFSSKYYAMEIINAFKYDKKIYPIFLEEATIPDQLQLILGNLHHVRYYTNPEKILHELENALPKDAMRALETDLEGTITLCTDGNDTIKIPAEIKGKKVRTIGTGAFKQCVSLVNLTIGENVKVIEAEAFRGCSGIKDLLLPEGVDVVGDSAFRDCINLENLVIERNIDLLDRAFENCPKLKNITFPEGFAEVNNGVFNSCKSLSSINLPASVTIIGESAFADCDSLTEIRIPPKTIKINDFAFSNCKRLRTIILNDNLNKIGKNAFQYCTSLQMISIPQSIAQIGGGAFKGCKELTKLEVNPKNRYYRSTGNVLFTKNKSELLVYPPKLLAESYEIPDSVMRVSDYAFFGCQNLKSITITDSLVELGEGAFYDCQNIERIEISDSVVKIEDMCFRNCTNLKEIVVPDTVKEIGWGIFRGCSFGIWKNEKFELVVICSEGSPIDKYCTEKGIKTKR